MRLGLAAILCAMGLEALPTEAETFQEDFANDPLARGWHSQGNASLFHWDAGAQALDVTWDSSQPNSYFHWPLPRTLTGADDFSVEFDLRINELAVGVDPEKPDTFPLSVGFLNLQNAINPAFERGSGVNSAHGGRSIVEFVYFPDSGLGATLAPTVISANNQFAYSHNFPLELTAGDLFRVTMTYVAETRTLKTRVAKNGQPFGIPPDGTIKDAVLGARFTDFGVDTLAVCNYNDGGQSPPQFSGSLAGTGVIDNIRLTFPGMPEVKLGIRLAPGGLELGFDTRVGARYTVEMSADLRQWSGMSQPILGDGSAAVVTAPLASPGQAFYRVRIE